MPVLALMGPRSRLVVRGSALHIERDGELVREVATHEIEEVQIYGRADLSADARNLLLREAIDVVFLTADGRYRGRLEGVGGRQGARRLAQYAFCAEPSRRLALARALIVSKLGNQRAILMRRQELVRDPQVADALLGLRAAREQAAHATSLEGLRGVEGRAAALYFDAFGRVLRNPDFVFGGRTRYPPRDPINALLSYGYSLLLLKVDAAIRAAGLDVHLGVLHEATRGAPALALDLMEELRPAVDGVVLSLINLRQVGPDDFRAPDPEELGERAELADGAVFLSATGRTILLRAWEQRLLESQAHPTRQDRWALRDLLREQGWQAARIFEGEQESWAPLVLRS